MGDVRNRIEQARLNGDQTSYDALRAGLEKTKAATKAAEARQAEHEASSVASAAAFEDEKRANYESVLAESKEMQMATVKRMGYQGKEAEKYYETWFAPAAVTAAQRISGYTVPTAPIVEENE